jgi:hypothetical protein
LNSDPTNGRRVARFDLLDLGGGRAIIGSAAGGPRNCKAEVRQGAGDRSRS